MAVLPGTRTFKKFSNLVPVTAANNNVSDALVTDALVSDALVSDALTSDALVAVALISDALVSVDSTTGLSSIIEQLT